MKLPICDYTNYCASCRDREGGKEFRQTIANKYDVDDVDFECPKDKPWKDEVAPVEITVSAKSSIKGITINENNNDIFVSMSSFEEKESSMELIPSPSVNDPGIEYKEENISKSRDCEFCEDIDSYEYSIAFEDIRLCLDKLKPEFDINGYKSIEFELGNIDINQEHIVTQQRSNCLWSKTIPKALIKYSYSEKSPSSSAKPQIDLINIDMYLERIDSERWWVTVEAEGGYQIFSSVVAVEKGNCYNSVEFLNDFKTGSCFEDSNIVNYKGVDSMFGNAIGQGGRAIVKCNDVVKNAD